MPDPTVRSPPRWSLAPAPEAWAGAASSAMGARVRAHDWAATPLGAPEGWPEALRTVAALVLDSKFPKLLMWGPELVQLYNDACAPILGACHPAALGRSHREAWPELWALTAPIVARVIERGEAVFLEDHPYVYGEPSAEHRFTVCYSPVRVAGGTVGGVLMTLIETTERVRAEREREQLIASLREASARKDEFLAMLAHELRNPLAPIVNATRLLAHGEPLSERGQAARALIERQAQHMRRLLDDLLDVSRVTRGAITLQCEPVLLGTVVQQAVEAVLPAIEARGQTLDIAQPARPLRLVADAVRLVQVLVNLLGNASKFTPAHGALRLEARDAGEAVELCVADSGCGIDPAQIDTLFEPFRQLDATLDRAQGGLGIGLALVRRLVELHGGSVQAASAGAGCGATFTVRLPRAAPGAAGAPA